MEEGGAEDEDGQNPIESIDGSSMVPEVRNSPFGVAKEEAQGRENEDVDPSDQPGNGGDLARAMVGAVDEGNRIDSNEAADGQFLNYLGQVLARGGIGLDYGTTGGRLDERKTAAINLQVFVLVVGIVGLYRGQIRVTVTSVVTRNFAIPSLGGRPGSASPGDAGPCEVRKREKEDGRREEDFKIAARVGKKAIGLAKR